MICPECYSDNPRITPMINPKHCLKNHTQYICSKCGRCICISKDLKGKIRWNFPFKSLKIAEYYLKTVEITCKKKCCIYEIISKKGRKFYKIFTDKDSLSSYLKKKPDKNCTTGKPLYISKKYTAISKNQIRKLTEKEITEYLNEKIKL